MEAITASRLKNSQLPISRLPPEILGDIFIQNIFECSTDFIYRLDPRSPTNCVHVISVCYYWREVALNHPQFWGFWSKLGSRWFKSYASRCEVGPLHIRVTRSSRAALENWETVFPAQNYLERIRELHIQDIALSLNRMLKQFDREGKYSSQLRSLMIYSTAGDIPAIPPSLTSHEFPYLWRFDLLQCDFDWNCRMLDTSQLRILSVRNELTVGATRPTAARLIAVLQCQQRLEKLTLTGLALPTSLNTVSKVPEIDLPRLSHLELTGTSAFCLSLTSCLRFPRNTSFVSLQIRLKGLPAYTNEVLPFLRSYYGVRTSEIQDAPTITDLYALFSSTEIVIHCRHQHPIEPGWVPHNLMITAGILSILDEFDALEIMTGLCEVLPLGQLRYLHVAASTMSSDQWATVVFARMANLEELRIDIPGNESEVLHALTPTRREEGLIKAEGVDLIRDLESLTLDPNGSEIDEIPTSSSWSIVLPNLKRLILDDADGDSSFDALLLCVMERYRAQVPLESLQFAYNYSASFIQEKTDALREWVEIG